MREFYRDVQGTGRSAVSKGGGTPALVGGRRVDYMVNATKSPHHCFLDLYQATVKLVMPIIVVSQDLTKARSFALCGFLGQESTFGPILRGLITHFYLEEEDNSSLFFKAF